MGPRYLDPNKLRLLKEGCFGLNNVFLLNVVFAIGTNALFSATQIDPTLALVVLPLFPITIGILTYPSNKKIGLALGWQPSGAIFSSILMGLFAWICCGAFGCMVMQNKALAGMKETVASALGYSGLRKAWSSSGLPNWKWPREFRRP